MSNQIPVAVVGASWRTAPTTTRSAVNAIGAGPESPSEALRQAGYLDGSVCISTCSRTEWVLTAKDPAWAADLLKSALLTRLGPGYPGDLQVRTGEAALHHLFRVAVGLDAVAEGEAAVGRQVLKAFEKGRTAGTTDKQMKLVWKNLERLLKVRKVTSPGGQGRGVQSLALDALREQVPAGGTVAVLGRGDIGLATERALMGAGLWKVTTWSRATLAELMELAPSLDGMVVCTGASAPWLELPRSRCGVAVDVGSPAQVKSAPGWTVLGLDALLSRPNVRLDDDERERLEELVMNATHATAQAFTRPSPAATLAAIDSERSAFLNEQLPQLLEGLPEERVRRVRQAVGAFTHAILQRAREPQP